MMKYLPALLLYIQRRVESGKGGMVSIKTRNVCGEDRRCGRVVHSLMLSLVEKGLAKQHKRGVYLIKRGAAEEVLTALKKWLEDGDGGRPSPRRRRTASRPPQKNYRRRA
jgi:hypothetical protein